MKLRLLSTLSLILCCAGSVLAYNLKYVRGLSNSSVLSIAQRPSGEMLFGTCDGLNSYDGNGMWLTAQNTGVVLYGNLVEDVKTVGGSNAVGVGTSFQRHIRSNTQAGEGTSLLRRQAQQCARAFESLLLRHRPYRSCAVFFVV